MNILISDLEANTSLEVEAMNTLMGGCGYGYCCPPPPCYRPPRPWCGWGYKPYFGGRVKRFKGRNFGGMKLRSLRVGAQASI